MRVALALFIGVGCVWGYTNEAHRAELVSRPQMHPAATSQRAARMGYVPTNTVAFQNYALDLLLAEANRINRDIALGLPEPLTSDHVTRLTAYPKRSGVGGGITVLDRYRFAIDGGHFQAFADKEECWRTLESDNARLENLVKVKSGISKTGAARIAYSAIAQLGLTNQMYIRHDPEIIQRHYEDENGKIHLLPFFVVRWGKASVEMELSGVTGKLVNYENHGAPANLPLPTNYYKMLGVSTDHTKWGQQFGYDSHDTDAFQSFAAHFITDQMNRLIEAWHLPSRPLNTNDISWFSAKARTNDFDVSARFNDRFQLQIMQRRVQLLFDEARNLSAYSSNPTLVLEALKETNIISPAVAEAGARKALAALDLNSNLLELRTPAIVKRLTSNMDGKSSDLPLYEVSWWSKNASQGHANESATVTVHLSATSGIVVAYGNTSARTPQISLPTNYPSLIHLVPPPLIAPDFRSAK